MDEYAQQMLDGFYDELSKIAAVKPPSNSGLGKLLLPAAAGSALTVAAIRANRDRQMGRQLRLQQQQQGY